MELVTMRKYHTLS